MIPISPKNYSTYQNLNIFAKFSKQNKNLKRTSYQKSLCEDGAVVWEVGQESFAAGDHIEMSGFFTSAIICYAKDKKGRLLLRKRLIVPTLRVTPNATNSSFSHNFDGPCDRIEINGKKAVERLQNVKLRGELALESDAAGVLITRKFFPSQDKPVLIEQVRLLQTAETPMSIMIKPEACRFVLPSKYSVAGVPLVCDCGIADGVLFDSDKPLSNIEARLEKGQSLVFYKVYYALKEGLSISLDCAQEAEGRKEFIEDRFAEIGTKTGDKYVDALFAHCNLRGSESIFHTKNGLMHAPGGGNYYAALWTNDQCEYANPFFAFSGYEAGVIQAKNGYHLYADYMDFSDKPFSEKRALVTSIIAEGDGYWNGAGDRGDAAMYTYGITRFILALGDAAYAQSMMDKIRWCIDYSYSKLNAEGVIESDSDELENRFESGKCNLNTNCLVYDALGNAAKIARELGMDALQAEYLQKRSALKEKIEQYFGSEVEGFQTYRYCAEEPHLRSWICMPLTVGINTRAADTVRALYSDRLYQNGFLKSTTASKTTWDRSLLFAIRGTFLAGHADQAWAVLQEYARSRLTGPHSPYPYEAFPEGNMAHLAAESTLYCRILSEGLFGLEPVGFKKLKISPNLPNDCGQMTLYGLKLFGLEMDITVSHKQVFVMYGGKIYTGKPNEIFDFEACAFVRD